MTIVEIDGAFGEGGGQIVRSALALSLATGKACSIANIRAGRDKPGLRRQHLAAVSAAAQVGRAEVEGDRLGSQRLLFAPATVRPGAYRFVVGSAGSTTLVLQAVLPALLTASGPSDLVLEGGTHNPFAPPFDFLDRVLLPILNRMGPRIRARLERPGFYPAGGGLLHVAIEPIPRLAGIDLLQRGEIRERRALARVSNLPLHIAERELSQVSRALAWDRECLRSEQVQNAQGPGNVLTLEIRCAGITELFSGFGRRGVSAEQVAEGVAGQVRDYLASGAAVGPYLADQLLVPLALAGAGSFRTVPPTRHTLTNAEVVRKFVDVEFAMTRDDQGLWTVSVRSSA